MKTNGRRHRHSRVDVALAALVHLVTDDAWTPAGAARQLRSQVPDAGVLRVARLRVGRVLAQRPSVLAERAAVTLDAALASTSPDDHSTA